MNKITESTMKTYMIYNANGMPKLGQFLYTINKNVDDLNSGDAFRLELDARQLQKVIDYLKKNDSSDNAYILSDRPRVLVYDPMRDTNESFEPKNIKLVEAIVRKQMHRTRRGQ